MKILKRTLMVLALLLVVLVVAVSFFLGSIVKTAINKVGPEITGVPVVLEDAAIYPLRGKAKLRGLTVGNPEGFKSENIFALGEVDIALKPLSVFSDTIQIERIYVDAPEIAFEGSLGGSNLKKLLKQIEERTGGPKEEEEEPAEEPVEEEEAEQPGKKVVIDHFLLENGKVTLGMNVLPGVGAGAPLPLPKVELHDLGKEKEASIGSVIKDIINAIMKAVFDLVKGSVNLVGDGVGAAADAAGAVGGAAVGAAGEAGGAAADAVGAAGGAAKDAVNETAGKIRDGIGGLLGGKKEKTEE